MWLPSDELFGSLILLANWHRRYFFFLADNFFAFLHLSLICRIRKLTLAYFPSWLLYRWFWWIWYDAACYYLLLTNLMQCETFHSLRNLIMFRQWNIGEREKINGVPKTGLKIDGFLVEFNFHGSTIYRSAEFIQKKSAHDIWIESIRNTRQLSLRFALMLTLWIGTVLSRYSYSPTRCWRILFGKILELTRMCVCYPLGHNPNYLAISMKAMQHQNFPLSLVVSFLVRMTSAQLTSVWGDKKKKKNRKWEYRKQ